MAIPIFTLAGDADGADEETHPVFLLGEDMLDARSDGRPQEGIGKALTALPGFPICQDSSLTANKGQSRLRAEFN